MATKSAVPSRPKFKFLIVSNQPKTAKEREKETTEIRTHAARASYRKKPPPSRRTAAVGLTKASSSNGSSSSASPDNESTSNDSEDSLALGLRTHLLGGGRVDPFASDSVPDLPAWILDLVDNAWTNAWCEFRPHRYVGMIHPDVFGWRKAGLSYPSLVHAHISGAIGIAIAQGAVQQSWSQLRQAQIYHATVAINYVRKELGRIPGPPPDELLLSIMTLSGHGEVDPEYDRPSTLIYNPSPLYRANRIDIFAKMRITDAHAQAIGTLVGKKGGLDNITLPGFRGLLSLTDVLQSTIKSTQPKLPFVGETDSLVSSGKHVLDSKALECSTTLGTGFEHAHVMDVSAELYTTLLAVCEVTAALDHLQRNENNPPALVDIVEYRKYVQYRILSLAPVSSSSSADASLADEDSQLLYEATRVAMMIYSDLNVWPLPPSTKVRPRLAKQLHRVLLLGNCDTLPPDLLLWLALMGAIASAPTSVCASSPDPEIDEVFFFFLDVLARDTGRISSWSAFADTMRQFLWCDFVVAPTAETIWRQAWTLRDL